MASKETHWLGTIDGSFTTAGNWDNGVPASVVASAFYDTVVMDAAAVRGPSSNLDQTAHDGGNGLHFAEFRVMQGFRYNVGAAATPLKATATTFRQESTYSSVYWSNTRGASGTNRSTRAIVNADKLANALVLTGSARLEYLEVIKGGVTVTHVSVAADDAIHYIIVGYRDNQVCNARVTLNTPTLFQKLEQYGGIVYVSGAVPDVAAGISNPSVWLRGGIMTFTTAIAFLSGGSVGAPDIVVTDGLLNYKGTSTTAANKPIIACVGGITDLTLTSGVTVLRTDRWPTAVLRKGPSTSITTEVDIGV